jgi:hypothetical protein
LPISGMQLTNAGVILHAKVQTGTTSLVLTKVEIGSGQLTEGQDITELNALINSEMTLAISSVTVIGDGTARVRCTAINTGIIGGFYLREVGIFATDPDNGEILFAASNAGDQADYFPAEGGPVAVEHQIDMIIVIGNAASVSISVLSESIATSLAASFEEHRTLTPLDHADNSVTDNKIGNRTINDTIEAGSGAGLLTTLLSKIGWMIKSITGKAFWYTPPATTLEAANAHACDTSNPHSTTAAQTGALPIDGGDMTGGVNEAKGADIASASTCNIGAVTAGNYVRITGTVTINSFGIAQAGTRRKLRFSGETTIIHNATSMILMGSTNITTVPGNIYEFTSEGGGNWRQTDYFPVSGKYNPLPGPIAKAAYMTPGIYTYTAISNQVLITGCGGGGAGGGSNNNSNYDMGGGGGGGACAMNYLLNVTKGQAYTVTVGAGGVGQYWHGPAGGLTSFGSLLTLPGGGGGSGETSSGAGGAPGGVGARAGLTAGAGGDTIFGFAGRHGSELGGSGAGESATGYGAGGGGGNGPASGQVLGGSGGPGFMIIEPI